MSSPVSLPHTYFQLTSKLNKPEDCINIKHEQDNFLSCSQVISCLPQIVFILRIKLLLPSTASSTAKLKHFISAQCLHQSQEQKQLLSREGLKANISVSWDVLALVSKKVKIQILFWVKLWCLHLGSSPLVKCPLRQFLKAKKSLKNLALKC